MAANRDLVVLDGDAFYLALGVITVVPATCVAIIEPSADELKRSKAELIDHYDIRFDTRELWRKRAMEFEAAHPGLHCTLMAKLDMKRLEEHDGYIVHSVDEAKAALREVAQERQQA